MGLKCCDLFLEYLIFCCTKVSSQCSEGKYFKYKIPITCLEKKKKGLYTNMVVFIFDRKWGKMMTRHQSHDDKEKPLVQILVFAVHLIQNMV